MKKTIVEILTEMIEYSEGNLHDINHLIKVWTYARTIGQLEKIDEKTQYILECAAILHDIACPLCREKYGNTKGPLQEKEGAPLAVDFLKDTGMDAYEMNRIAYLVGHHHTLDQVDGPDYQILLEADYIVNAEEAGYSLKNIMNMKNRFFKTESGKRFLECLYLNKK